MGIIDRRPEDVLVSVIIPVYNVRDYLEQCVESVIGQTHSNLEITLVDDGSTDGSGDLCDELVDRDSRIQVIHKKNGGLSSARNLGLSISHGDYILFVDSDDYISEIYIEIMLYATLIINTGMAVIPNGVDVYADNATTTLLANRKDAGLIKSQICKLRKEEYIQGLLYQKFNTGAQYRLYKRDVLILHPFRQGILYEDLESVYRCVHDMKSDAIALVDCPMLYAYRQRCDGIIRQEYRPLKADSALLVSRKLYENISSWYPKLVPAAASRCFSVNRMVFAQIPVNFKTDKHRVWKELKQYRFTIVFDSHARKRERLAALISCLGYSSFSLFCQLARRMGLLR